MTNDARWFSAHIYYYARDRHDDVILDALRPIVAEVAEAVVGAYFERHWLRGPHLRLHIRTPADAWSTAVQPVIEREVGRYLREHPSTASIDMSAALPEHRLLAALERESGPLTPFVPDNTVRFVPYDRRLHVLGGLPAAELLADFHSDATDLLFAMMQQIRQGSSRLETCLNLMFALAQTACPPITRGFVSYRSHVEYFLANCADPGRTRENFEARYDSNRRGLTERLEAVLQMLEGGTETVPFIADWVALWQEYQRRGERLLERGEIDFDDHPDQSPARQRVSGFQETLERDGVWSRIYRSVWFRSYRLLLNYTYLQMNRLGCSPAQRYLLCYVASRTVEDMFGVTAIDSARTPGDGSKGSIASRLT